MRKLTEDELKLAPDWATHYFILSDDLIQFESELYYAKLNSKTKNLGKVQCNKEYGIAGVKIPFDINKHDFSYKKLLFSEFINEKFELMVKNHPSPVFFNIDKDDAIAIAKALGVTGDDLK